MRLTTLLTALVAASFGMAWASSLEAPVQATSRGTAIAYPPVFDDSGTNTSRETTANAVHEILNKGGFKTVEPETGESAWTKLGYKTPGLMSPPTLEQLAKFGKAVSADFVVSTKIHFHTRSIWVNLGPKTISTCTAHVTVVDVKKNKIAYEKEAEGRSDEKSDGLKIAGSLLITPLITAVSGGPKTPQEQRAGQIAVAKALNDFIVVK